MKKKLEKFLATLDDYGEYYFTSGSIKDDYEQIKAVLKYQGFWSGVYCRLYFDDNFNLIRVAEK